jgi:AP endonuclease-2
MMIDITRKFHPTRQGMFTCSFPFPAPSPHPVAHSLLTGWNTKIDARPSNFGTRLDYILVTPGLLPWVNFSDIQAKVVGSDHCPVYIDFHDELEIEGRGKVSIWDELNPGRQRSDPLPDAPPFAARFYDEFSGKQKTLASFFGKKGDAPPPSTKLPTPSPSPQPTSSTAPQASTSASRPYDDSPFSASQPLATKASIEAITSGSGKKKGKGKEKEKTPPKEEKEKKVGQGTLANFFKPPPKPEAPKKKRKKSKTSDSPPPPGAAASSTSRSRSSSSQAVPPAKKSTSATDSDDDILIIEDPNQPPPPPSPGPPSQSDRHFSDGATEGSPSSYNADSASAWSNIFASKPPPLCDGHGEPAKMWTVNKTGINKGRRFFMCARCVSLLPLLLRSDARLTCRGEGRPVGPGYDRGQAKLHVDPQWRCDFWQCTHASPSSSFDVRTHARLARRGNERQTPRRYRSRLGSEETQSERRIAPSYFSPFLLYPACMLLVAVFPSRITIAPSERNETKFASPVSPVYCCFRACASREVTILGLKLKSSTRL